MKKHLLFKFLLTFLLALFTVAWVNGQTTIWTEDFSTGTYSVTLGAEGNDGTADYFNRTDGSNIGITYTGQTGYFFAAQDIDDSGWTGSASPSQLTWTGINITDYTSLEFDGLFASNATAGIDDSDYAIVEYQIDGGGWNNLIAFENEGSQYNTYFLEDGNFDGTGEGTQLTSTFASFNKSITGTGTSLDIRFTVAANSGGEDIAIEDFEISGTLATSNNTDSEVSASATLTEPATISSLLDTEGEKVEVFDFTLTDLGTSDGLASIIDQIQITQGDNNDITDWTTVIAGAVLNGTDVTDLAGTINSSNITFAGDDMISVADGASETYTLSIWLTTTGGLTEDDNLEFALSYSDITSDAAGSFFGSGAPESGDANLALDITATQLAFIVDPTDVYVDVTISPAVEVAGTDENENVDVDYSFSITLTYSGTAIMSGTSTVAATSGVASFNDLSVDAEESTVTLAANDGGFSEATSSTFNVNAFQSTTLPYNEDFATDLGTTFTYNLSGETKEWYQTSDYAYVSGYNSGDVEEDWLIFPVINLDSYSDEVMVFESWWKYGSDDASNYFKLVYSTDYIGGSDPSTATWTDLSFTVGASDTWTGSGEVDLSAITGTSVYIAFQYHYESGSYKNWGIKNVIITEPAITITSPADNTIFDTETDVTVDFIAYNQTDLLTLQAWVPDPGAWQPMETDIDPATGTVTTTVPADAAESSSYKLRLIDQTDSDPISNEVPIGVNDVSGPVFNYFDPVDESSDVARNQNLIIDFNEDIKAGTGNIIVKQYNSDNQVASYDVTSATEIDITGTTLTITPSTDWPNDSMLYVEMATGVILDLQDNDQFSVTKDEWNFEIADEIAPQATFDPADTETDVAKDIALTISFDEAIYAIGPGTTPFDNTTIDGIITFKLTNDAGADVAFDATINGTNDVITITPDENMTAGQVYYYAISDQYKDEWGNQGSTDNATFTVYASNDATVSSSEYTVDNTGNTITDIPYGTTLATFEGNLTPAAGATFDTYESDGLTEANDLATGYKVIGIAEDGTTTKTYTITVTPASTDATLSDLTVSMGSLEPIFNSTTYSYTVELPYGEENTPTVTATENDPNAKAVVVDATDITSSTAADRTTTVTVTAEDASTQDYTILFNVAASNAKQLKDFSFVDPAVTGTVTEVDKTVAITVPYGTNLTALVASFTTTGQEVKVGTVTQTSGVTANNFSDPVTYTVVAADASTQDYVVTVSVTPAATDATLSALSTDMGTLVPTFDAATEDYTVELPYGTTDEPTVSATENDPNANAVITQVSDIEGDLAARTATIVVTAEDGSTTKTYTIVYSVAPNNDATITSSEYTVNSTENTITGVPYGTSLATFEANLTPADGASFETFQADGTTSATDVATGYKVVVTAEDGSTTKTYTITVIAPNTDATLSSLDLTEGTLDPTFDAATYEYSVVLAAGTSTVPTVSAVENDPNANAVVTQATNLDGTEAERTATVVVTAEDGSTQLTYSVIFELEPEGDLFFSEYIEGSSNNKALEIYNPTSSNVDLTPYSVKLGSNGDDWGNTLDLTGTLNAGEVYIIANASATAAILDIADVTSNVTYYNGDDALGLFKNDVLIDVIGTQGEDPGTAWDVAGETEATAEHTLLRKINKTTGNTNWVASAGTNTTDSEWEVKNQDYFDDLGSYGPKTGTDILTFDFVGITTGAATINTTSHTVDIEVSYGTSPTALVATFTLSAGASARVGTVDQVSGTTANDFSSPVTYTITAEDASTQNWTVTVTVSTTQSSLKEITGFTVEGIIGTADYGDGTVNATVEYGTDITSLKPTFEISPLATIADTAAARDFTNPQTYVVTAEDGSTKDWIVTITAITPTDVSDIASLRALYSETNETIYKITGEVTITFINDRYVYIQDATAAILIFNGNGAVTTAYNIGDNIQNVVAIFGTYGGNMQLSLMEDPGTAISSGNTISPQVVTIPTLAANYADYDAELVIIEDIKIKESGVDFESGKNYKVYNGTDTVILRTNFSDADYIGTPISAETLDITAIAGIYNETIQIYPRLLSDIVVVTTGINNPDGIVSMNIYPNPSEGLFTLEMNASKAGNFNVDIINIQGQVIYTKQINQDGFYKDQIDLTNEASGIYYIRINDGNSMKVSKIMIQ